MKLQLARKLCRLILLFTILVGAGSVPAFPASAQSIGFRVGEQEIAWELPKNYCLPVDQSAAVAQVLAALDTVNVTHLSLY